MVRHATGSCRRTYITGIWWHASPEQFYNCVAQIHLLAFRRPIRRRHVTYETKFRLYVILCVGLIRTFRVPIVQAFKIPYGGYERTERLTARRCRPTRHFLVLVAHARCLILVPVAANSVRADPLDRPRRFHRSRTRRVHVIYTRTHTRLGQKNVNNSRPSYLC